MNHLTSLERSVLLAIAAQASGFTELLTRQIDIARVTNRENTGHGFFATIEVETNQLLVGIHSPVGDVGATVEDLEYGMGFLLWVKRGLIHQLEGYSYCEDTSRINFERAKFRDVEPRGTNVGPSTSITKDREA